MWLGRMSSRPLSNRSRDTDRGNYCFLSPYRKKSAWPQCVEAGMLESGSEPADKPIEPQPGWRSLNLGLGAPNATCGFLSTI